MLNKLLGGLLGGGSKKPPVRPHKEKVREISKKTADGTAKGPSAPAKTEPQLKLITDIDDMAGLKPASHPQIVEYLNRQKTKIPAVLTQDFKCYQVQGTELTKQETADINGLLIHARRFAPGGKVAIHYVSRPVFETFHALLAERTASGRGKQGQAREGQAQVDIMLSRAIRNKATDIHIEISDLTCKVYERVYGILRLKEHFGADQGRQLNTAVWNIYANQPFSEADVAKDGRFEYMHRGKGDTKAKQWLCRVSYAMSKPNKEASMAIRLRDMNDIPGLDVLGYSDRQLWLIRRAMQTKGMILMIGSVNSGKSTTQTAIMEMRPDNKKNFELSDQIEVKLPNFVQIQMPTEGTPEQLKENRERLMRVSTRHDVNFIAINEIRDQLTGAMASAMLLQGTAAISSIHGSSWADAINRLKSPTDLAISPDVLFSESFLSLLITQMLISVLCRECRLQTHPDPETQAYYTEILGPDIIEKVRWRNEHKDGTPSCEACGDSGIEGLTLAAEVIPVNESNRHLLKDTTNAQAMRDWQKKNDVATIHQHAYSKIIKGTIDPAMAEEKLGPFTQFNLFEAFKGATGAAGQEESSGPNVIPMVRAE